MAGQRKKIVCLGGGNAMPKTVLAGLKKEADIDISVVSAMLDSGGTAGKEREIYNTNISFGDIRRSFLALSEAGQDVKDSFSIRFEEGDYKGIVIANILGTAIAHKTHDYEKALRVYEEVLKVPSRYKVLPVTLDDAHLCAKLDDGGEVVGEANIDIPKHNPDSKITEVFLKPVAKAYPKAIEEIKSAGLIVIGPGDLYSSLAQILLVEGISEAILESRAKKVYVCNLMTKRGETDNFSVQDFTREIEKYLKGEVDFVVYNNETPSLDQLEGCRKAHPELIEQVGFGGSLPEDKFLGENLLSATGVNHDPDKLSKAILNLCKQ